MAVRATTWAILLGSVAGSAWYEGFRRMRGVGTA
jgi:hypothetical protein